jgi:catechol 2,3-dioxygenase-like lactoylglutathione lyase family enzyme
MPSVNGILETALYVRDIERAATFYRRLLDTTTLLESDRLIALGVAGRSVLLLFKEGTTSEDFVTPGGTIPAHAGAGPTHFAFSIARDDVNAWKQFLAVQSVPIESTVSWPGGAESIYFRDPDQNLVELITPGFWKGIGAEG